MHHAVRALQRATEGSLGASCEPCALFFTYTSHRKFSIFSVEMSRCVVNALQSELNFTFSEHASAPNQPFSPSVLVAQLAVVLQDEDMNF